jgi:hypothetical protein
VIDAVEAVTRLILVGDPRQFPPSGRGQPFVVIVTGLEPINIEPTFPRVGPQSLHPASPSARRCASGRDVEISEDPEAV